MRFVLFVALSFVFGMTLPAGGNDDPWLEEADRAVRQATDQSKDLLLLFTGSDWCPPCQRLEEEILAKEDFLREAQVHFVLVKFDFPQNRELPAERRKQNEEWQTRFGVSGYPTIVLMDKNQLPYGFLGYEPGGLQPFLGQLEEFRQKRLRRDEQFAKADQAQGLERAKFLDMGLSQLDEQVARVYYAERIEELAELDAEDELGLKTKWFAAEEAEKQKLILTDILTISRLEKPERAIAFIDEVLQIVDFEIERKIEVLQIKLNLLQASGQVDAAAKLLDELIARDDVLEETKERLKVKKSLQLAGARGPHAGLEVIEQYLATQPQQPFLNLAKAQLLQLDQQPEAAVQLLTRTESQALDKPDLLIEIVSTRADLLCGLNRHEEALQILDTFADNLHMPTDLRCEALLHKAMIMRETSRRRPAILAENRAIEIADSPELKREIQQVVEQLRKKLGDP